MKKTRKLFALILTVLMLISSVPMSSQAASILKAPSSVAADGYVDSVELYWNDVLFASGYRVFQYKGGKWEILGDTADSYYYIENLQPYTSYKFAVRPFNYVLGKCTWCDTYTTVSTKTTGLDDFYYFEGYEEDGEIVLEWDWVDGADGYRVFQYSGGKWVKLKDLSEDDTYYTISKYTPGAAYYFTVRAYKKTAKGVIWNALPETVKVQTVDKRKAVITQAVSTEKAITLKWNKAADATGYRVYQYKGGKWTALKTTTALSYTVTGLKHSTAYYFRVKAYKKVGTTVTWYPTSDTYKAFTLADYATRKQAVDLYNKGVNYAKTYQGTLNLANAETISIDVTDAPAAIITTVNSVVDSFEEPVKKVYSFKKGVDANGREATNVIYPVGKSAALPVDAVKSAIVKTNADGSKYIEFTLIEEKGSYDGYKISNPKYNSQYFACFDPAQLDISAITVEESEIVYTGTKVKAKLDSKGRITALVIEIPSEWYMTASVYSMELTMGFDLDLKEGFTFTYK